MGKLKAFFMAVAGNKLKHKTLQLIKQKVYSGDRMRKIILSLCLLLALSGVASADSFDIVRPDKDSWVCVDYSVDFARNNPGWGIVSFSYHPYFVGVSHMVNYRIIDNETILIHDEMYNAEYKISGWQHDSMYYHFWIDEQIKRNYVRLFDNRGLVI